MAYRRIALYILRLRCSIVFILMTFTIYQSTQFLDQRPTELFGDQKNVVGEETEISSVEIGEISSNTSISSSKDEMLEEKAGSQFGKSHAEGDCFASRHQSAVKFLIQSMKSAEMEMMENSVVTAAATPEPEGRILDDEQIFMDMMDSDDSEDLFVRSAAHVHANAELREAIESDHVSCAERDGPIETTFDCFGSSAHALGRYCRFKNVCYRDSKLVIFSKSLKGPDIDIPEQFHIGVGYRTRGSGSAISTSVILAGSEEQSRWFDNWTPCWVLKPSIMFTRSWRNYYFTIYTAFALYTTLKEQIPNFPANFSQDDILLFWTGTIPGRQPPSGLFETFSDTAASSLAELDRNTDIGICFEDVIVGVTKNALLGEDVWFDPSYCPPPPEGSESEIYRDVLPNKGSENGMNWRKYVYVGTEVQERAAKRSSAAPIECDARYREETSAEALREFKDYMIHIHGLTDARPTQLDKNSSKPKILLLSRSRRRLIMNEEELLQSLQDYIPHADVSLAKFDSLSFHEQMQLARRSHVLVGMHGAGFANALWLSDESSFIELFPYRYYKPTYQLLASMAQVRHTAWQNGDVRNTRLDWNRLGSFLNNLSAANRTRILLTTRFPGVSDSALRNFFKNQDTLVDVASVADLIQEQVSN